MIVVSDTSPILSLARIGRLDLLETLYREVIIPPAVFAELESALSGSTTPIAFDQLPWIVTATPQDSKRVDSLAADLDLGEAEAIALAIERKADLLLVDERRGRRTAMAAGLAVTGLVGVVAEAKRVGILVDAKPVLDALIRVGRFGIGRALYVRVLEEMGEG